MPIFGRMPIFGQNALDYVSSATSCIEICYRTICNLDNMYFPYPIKIPLQLFQVLVCGRSIKKMSNIVPPEVYKTLKGTKREHEKFEIVIHDFKKEGYGFLEDMVYVTLNNKKSNEEFHLIVKQAFTNQAVRESNPIHMVYKNEIYFYTEVWKLLNQFQQTTPRQY